MVDVSRVDIDDAIRSRMVIGTPPDAEQMPFALAQLLDAVGDRLEGKEKPRTPVLYQERGKLTEGDIRSVRSILTTKAAELKTSLDSLVTLEPAEAAARLKAAADFLDGIDYIRESAYGSGGFASPGPQMTARDAAIGIVGDIADGLRRGNAGFAAASRAVGLSGIYLH